MVLGAVPIAFVITSCPRENGSTRIQDAAAGARVDAIVRGLGGEPATLDPAHAEDDPALAMAADLYEGLTAEAPDGAIVPGAAERWSVSSDGRRWTFRLRAGLRWSDGAALDASHFAGALAALRAPGSTAPYAGLLDGIDSVQATDGATVTIEVARPMPQLPAILALPFASPLRADAKAELPVSNGPYRIVSRVPGASLLLERNPHFHDAGHVPVAQVRYLTVADLGTELNLYRAGDLDVTSEVPNAQIDWITRNLPGQLHLSPYLSTYAYAVNLRRVDDAHARAALALAMDRPRIVGKVTGAGERPAYSWVPPGIPGYSPPLYDWRDQSTAARQEAARAQWTRASSRPAKLKLCTDASANHRRTAVALADEWRHVLGLETEIVELEWKAYLAQREHPGDCDLLRFGWSADYVDPEAFLALFQSGHPQNVGGYANPRYDALLAAAAGQQDTQLRAASLAEAERLLLADGVVLPVFHRVSKRLVRPDISGVVDNPLGHLQSRWLRREPPAKK